MRAHGVTLVKEFPPLRFGVREEHTHLPVSLTEGGIKSKKGNFLPFFLLISLILLEYSILMTGGVFLPLLSLVALTCARMGYSGERLMSFSQAYFDSPRGRIFSYFSSSPEYSTVPRRSAREEKQQPKIILGENFGRTTLRKKIPHSWEMAAAAEGNPSRTDYTHTGMFSDHRLALSGGHFEERFAQLGEQARENFAKVSSLLETLRPSRWHDVLTIEQERKTFWIGVPAQWRVVERAFKESLEFLPVLSVAFQTDPRYHDRLQYLVVGTADAYVAVFTLERLATQLTGWIKRAELVPEVIRKWLLDPDIFVVSSEVSELTSFLFDDISVTNHVNCDAVFLFYQGKGVVHPTFPVAKVDLAWLLTYALDYHHRPMEPKRFVHMVGQHSFPEWPKHRQPGWRPDAMLNPSPPEMFYFFL